jgi:DNA modification methylase
MQATKMPYKWSTATWITNGMARGALGFGNWIYTAIFSSLPSLHRNEQDFARISIKESDKFDQHILGAKRQKPPEYLTWLFSLFAEKDDVIFDPFAGSGTSVIVADRLGMRCVAIEKDYQTFCDVVARLDNYLDRSGRD